MAKSEALAACWFSSEEIFTAVADSVLQALGCGPDVENNAWERPGSAL